MSGLTNSSKIRNRIIRAIIARLLCLGHIGFSIYIIFTIKNKELIYLIPLFGAIFLVVETFLIIVFTKGKEPTTWFSPMFFIYVGTIVPCYWLLELENIKKTIDGSRQYGSFQLNKNAGDMVSIIKIIWSSLELQIFFALLIFIRWIIPKSNLSPQDLAELLVKYFVISCDMLDFLTILHDGKLMKNENLVYATLIIWAWSCFQFFIYVPTYDDDEKRAFSGYVSNTFLSVIFMDLPYLCLRITVIFGFGTHNYNSYYFVVKNTLMILLSLVRIRAAFKERKIRSDKHARTLKDKHGIDKQPRTIYDHDELAKKRIAQRQAKIVNLNLGNPDFLQINTNSDEPVVTSEEMMPSVSPRNQLVNRLQANQAVMKNRQNQYISPEDQLTLMNDQNHQNYHNSQNQSRQNNQQQTNQNYRLNHSPNDRNYNLKRLQNEV